MQNSDANISSLIKQENNIQIRKNYVNSSILNYFKKEPTTQNEDNQEKLSPEKILKQKLPKEQEQSNQGGIVQKTIKKKRKISDNSYSDNNHIIDEEETQYIDYEEIDKLPKNQQALESMVYRVNEKLRVQKLLFFKEQQEIQHQKSKVQDQAIPITADIRTFDFQNLAKNQVESGGRLFDAIMMDPPWQLSTSQPSRGVAIAYDSLGDDCIRNIPVQQLSTDGFIFIWVINAKYGIACDIMQKWGYSFVDEITWVKKTVNGKIAKGHGFYLQHAKESCLVGVKGNVEQLAKQNVACDVIFSARRGQSQKPEEIYQYVEELIPNGYYLEIFGRRNNLRNNWVTIGNEL